MRAFFFLQDKRVQCEKVRTSGLLRGKATNQPREQGDQEQRLSSEFPGLSQGKAFCPLPITPQ